MGRTALLAIDWGTTSARAYRVGVRGEILDRRSAPLGVQHIRDGDFRRAWIELAGDWAGLEVPRLACGMIGSRQGWVEAPYVECPAAFDDLARRLATTPGRELSVVPGLLARDAHGIPDVMRGEETQLAGAVEPTEHVLAVLPGTHSKWARVDAGTVAGFETHMTGELYGVLLEHSILGRLADPGAGAGSGPSAAFDRGVERGLAPGALAHDIFGARTLALTGALAADAVGDWLSGLLIGREVRAARESASGAGWNVSRVRVIGTDVLVARYARALTLAGVAAEAGPADAAVRGLYRIACATGLVPALA